MQQISFPQHSHSFPSSAPFDTLGPAQISALGLRIRNNHFFVLFAGKHFSRVACRLVKKSITIASASDYCNLLFSGLQKFNWRFFTVVGPWLLGASQCLQNSYENNTSLILASAALPFSELLLAILLFCKQTRKVGMWFGMIMHAYLLYMIGPWKLNTNPGVWPWNLVAILLLVSFFRNKSDDLLLRLNYKERPLTTIVLTVVCLVVPILGLLQITDPFPSFALYAGDVPYGKIMFEKSMLAKLTPVLQKDYSYYDERTGLWYVDINDWVYEESGASAYPSKLCFRLISRRFAAAHPGELVVLKLYTYPKLTKTAQTKYERLGGKGPESQP